MKNYEIKLMKDFDAHGVRNLFLDAGWDKYADRIDLIARGASKCLPIYGAYIGNELIGYIRAVGDGETIVYIQDLVVLSSHKRKGIARALVQRVLSDYAHVRQKVLITDDNEEVKGFYNSIGFKEAQGMGVVAFLKFDE